MLFVLVLIAVVCLMGYVCLTLILRCAGIDAVPLGRRRIRTEQVPALDGERPAPSVGLKALLWAAAVLGVLYAVSLIFCASLHNEVSWERFCQVWDHWDADHYLALAERGYRDTAENGEPIFLVFFPLYPWLIRLLHMAVPSYALCGRIISCLCFMGGCVVLARLVTEQFGWPAARTSLLLFTAYPFAFFFGAAYTESLFFLLSVTSFSCIVKHRWLPAGLFGALAALTRMQGALLILAGAAEYAAAERPFRRLKQRDWRGLWRSARGALLPLALILAGTGIYLWLNYAVAGDPFRFMVYQRDHWYHRTVPFWTCLTDIWTQMRKARMAVAFPTWGAGLAVFFLCLPALVYAARHMPVPWAVYFLACVLLDYAVTWPLSCGRYVACAFPLPVTAAVALRNRPGIGQAAALLLTLFQGIFLFVYLSGGQVY